MAETLEQANQRKFNEMADTIAVIRKVVYEEVMNVLNYKVKDVPGKEQSVFDLVRSVGGTYYDVPWQAFDGKQPTSGRRTTRVATMAGWADTLAATQRREIDTLKEIVKSIATSTGAVIDYDEIARKVNDEADRRERARLDTPTEEN